jgi:NAD(P)H-hydrate epimerase
MRGAAAMCARAALRAGAGMVHVGSPGVSADDHPASEAVARSLPAEEWDHEVVAALDRFRAVVVGPGLGRDRPTVEAVRRLVAASPVPIVVDADGLNALGDAEATAAVVMESKAPVVLTPHDGEFARLNGSPPGADRVGAARGLAARTGALVLLKGSTTVVAHPDGTVLFSSAGDARLATAGTGDVLSGVIGAFLAGGMSALPAAGLAAHAHGRAAHRGPAVGLIAGDLPDLVASVLSDALAEDL